LFFLAPHFPKRIEEHHMNRSHYYRNDVDFAWRFTTPGSGQPAASDRPLTGGNVLSTANPANCRTPQ
jgi:hypothetical protein